MRKAIIFIIFLIVLGGSIILFTESLNDIGEETSRLINFENDTEQLLIRDIQITKDGEIIRLNGNVYNFTVTTITDFLQIDDYEDNNLDEYSGNTVDATTSADKAQNGTYSIKLTKMGGNEVISTSGLDNYYEKGNGTLITHINLGTDATSDFLFGVTGLNSHYGVQLSSDFNEFNLYEEVGGTQVQRTGVSQSFNSNEWYRTETYWFQNNTIRIELYNEAGTFLNQIEYSDSTPRTGSGIGWNSGGGGSFTHNYGDNISVKQITTVGSKNVTKGGVTIKKQNENEYIVTFPNTFMFNDLSTEIINRLALIIFVTTLLFIIYVLAKLVD